MTQTGSNNYPADEAVTTSTDRGTPEVLPPLRKPLREKISGIDVLQMKDAARALKISGMYVETGMGCTGPVILVVKEDLIQALKILKKVPGTHLFTY